jgi:hypothetical protein
MLPSFSRLADLPEPYLAYMNTYYEQKKNNMEAKKNLLCNAQDSDVNDDDDGYDVYSNGTIGPSVKSPNQLSYTRIEESVSDAFIHKISE